jgi:O-antigen ligase
MTQPRIWSNRLVFGLLCTLVFTIPFDDIIAVPSFGTLTRLIGYATLLTAMFDVLSRGSFRSLRGPPTWVFLFVGWAALSVTWTSSFDSTMEKLPTIVRCLGLFWLLYEYADSQDRVSAFLQAYVLGAWVCIGGITHSLLSGQFLDDSDFTRYVVSQLDPNDLAAMLAIGLPIAWYLALTRKSRSLRWLNILYIPVSLTAAVLTGSRGGLVAISAAFLLSMWGSPILTLKRKAGISLLAVLVLGGASLVVPETSWMRFSTIASEVSEGTLSYRTTLWTAGFQYLSENPILGIGAGAFKHEVFARGGFFKPLVAHSTFLGVLFELGVIGFLLFAVTVASVFRWVRFIPIRDRRFFQFLLITWIIAGLTLSLEYRKVSWFLLGIAAAAVARSPWLSESGDEEPLPADAPPGDDGG